MNTLYLILAVLLVFVLNVLVMWYAYNRSIPLFSSVFRKMSLASAFWFAIFLSALSGFVIVCAGCL